MNANKKLVEIGEEIERCRECKIGKIGKAVVGEGSENAKIAFIGEAPGRQEALSGRPFIGRSGKLLRSLIKSIGLSEEEVYITSPVKYLPEKGTPSKKEIAHGKIHLDKQLAIIKPKLLVLLGKVAAFGVMSEDLPIQKNHGTVSVRNSTKYFITYHPSAGLRFPPLKKLLEEDFKKLKKEIKGL